MFADDDPEANWICDERWNVAEAMFECKPRTVADLAWQAEAYLLVDMEIVNSAPECSFDRMIRQLFQHIRTLGGTPQPDDPMGLLSIDTADYDFDGADEEA